MTYEEAVKLLTYLDGAIEDNHGNDYDTAFALSIEALEKQISKKPYMDNENGVYEKEHCPTCHRSLFPYDHHCQCGQAIDWSDT